MKISRKMNLKRETLRNLDNAALQAAQGGAPSPSGLTYDCPTTSFVVKPMPGHDPNTAPGIFYPCGLP